MTGRYSCRYNHCSFIYKTVSRCFEVLIFNQDIWGNVHYVREDNLISQGTLKKPFIYREKHIKENLTHVLVYQRELKMIMSE